MSRFVVGLEPSNGGFATSCATEASVGSYDWQRGPYPLVFYLCSMRLEPNLERGKLTVDL